MNNIKSYKELINESLGGGRDTTRPGGVKTFSYNKVVVLDGSLFKLGKDQIDTNNIQFKQAVEILKPLRNSEIEVTGSASAVGESSGFDNKKLALDRANNFIEALKKAGVDTSAYRVKIKVGKATVPNSPEADAEQNVKFKLLRAAEGIRFEQAIDNTATVKIPKIKIKDVDPPKIEDKTMEYMVFKLTYKKEKKNEIQKKIEEIKKLGVTAENVTSIYFNCVKSGIPYKDFKIGLHNK
jgi:hypothetical protein